MRRQPRPPSEPVINAGMRLGILIQTVAQTGAVLGAFALGLLWHLRSGDFLPPGANPLAFLLNYDWRGIDVQSAETMAFATLSLCELFRAYTVRSERLSVFRIGVFSNRYMQFAVGLSIVLLLLGVGLPFLQPVFNTHMPSAREWAVILGLALVPALAEELTKLFLRRKDRRTS
jgi:Ca2+-transporting ATPase